MKVIDMQQDGKEWLEWRNKGITATDIGVILGESPYATPFQLWETKTGRKAAPDLSRNPNVRRGVENEAVVRALVEAERGEDFAVVCGESETHAVCRASFDGLDSENVPHEFKCPSEAVYAEVEMLGEDSEAYKMYAIQVKYQALVAGAKHGWLYFYNVASQEMLKFKIELTQNDTSLEKSAMAFYELIQTNTPPEKDPLRDIVDGDPEMEAIACRLVQRKAQMQSLEQELAEFKAEQKHDEDELVEKMGLFDHYESKQFGVKVTIFERKGSVDYNAFFESKGINANEVEAFRKETTSSKKVTYTK